ncbi:MULTISPECIES: plasmid stabilization protein [unclassified Xanthomonas]|uniref:plasmid stabilization protein n=1 Tax=unclassified Xanthomonas TaxID=2643310 RepID=UPI000CEDD527|nr:MULTISPECIES: plasmid stabilization protein [unclassified Xanthomonas]PPU35779.1 plasmid stabilization protein [Xanthomonas sp. CFBP 7912]RJS02532.1 plasmid stabilization protein [Xanthomonas sp. CFBP 7698]
MSVAWKQSALDARTALLASAVARAIEISDPQIYFAACEQDDRIETEGDALDSAATYHSGPLPGTRLYTCQDGRYLLIYTCDGDDVLILALVPARSDWKPTSSGDQ